MKVTEDALIVDLVDGRTAVDRPWNRASPPVERASAGRSAPAH